jgi:predicted transcriptional regulator
LKPLQAIENAASKIAPGRAPYFIEVHIVKALLVISSQGPVGRVNLTKALGLGEGSIRTLIRHLEKAELIKTSREGIVLTGAGKKLVSSVESVISEAVEVPQSVLTVGAFNMAILVRSAAGLVRAGLEQRDAAIKVGAQGATTLVFTNGRLTMPSASGDVFRNLPKMRDVLISQLKPEEGDTIVIGSADDRLTAEFGAIAAALETLKAHRSEA